MYIDFEAKPMPFFVYGTLMTGLYNWTRLLAGFPQTAQSGSVEGATMLAYKDRFPYAVPGFSAVMGEVITVAEEDFLSALISLDALEGYHGPDDAESNHYVRQVVTVTLDDTSTVEAYMYVAAADTAMIVRDSCYRVSSGSWKQWLSDVEKNPSLIKT